MQRRKMTDSGGEEKQAGSEELGGIKKWEI